MEAHRWKLPLVNKIHLIIHHDSTIAILCINTKTSISTVIIIITSNFIISSNHRTMALSVGSKSLHDTMGVENRGVRTPQCREFGGDLR